MSESPSEAQQRITKRPLEYVALWQFLTFLLLITFIWASEIVDIPHLVWGSPPSPVDWLQACILTASVLAVGVVSVGHTYIQERRILRGFIIVCSYCHKVRIDDRAWQQMEMFVADRTLAEFSHGVCPICYEKVISQLENEQRRATQPGIDAS